MFLSARIHKHITREIWKALSIICCLSNWSNRSSALKHRHEDGVGDLFRCCKCIDTTTVLQWRWIERASMIARVLLIFLPSHQKFYLSVQLHHRLGNYPKKFISYELTEEKSSFFFCYWLFQVLFLGKRFRISRAEIDSSIYPCLFTFWFLVILY